MDKEAMKDLEVTLNALAEVITKAVKDAVTEVVKDAVTEVVKDAVKETLRSEREEALKAGSIEQGTETPKYLTRAQVCELLSVSQTTLTTWKRKGILPIHKVGGRTLYKRDDIYKAVKAQRGARVRNKAIQ